MLFLRPYAALLCCHPPTGVDPKTPVAETFAEMKVGRAADSLYLDNTGAAHVC